MLVVENKTPNWKKDLDRHTALQNIQECPLGTVLGAVPAQGGPCTVGRAHCLCLCPLRKKHFNKKILFWEGPGRAQREKCRALKCAGNAGVGLTSAWSKEERLSPSPLLSLEVSLLLLPCPPAHLGELQTQCQSQPH